jgi:hypothetical protein
VPRVCKMIVAYQTIRFDREPTIVQLERFSTNGSRHGLGLDDLNRRVSTRDRLGSCSISATTTGFVD